MNFKDKAIHRSLEKHEEKKFKMAKKMQKGKQSLNMPKGEKNEGEKMYLGKNEHNRA